MTANYYCLLENHSVLWGSGMLTVNHYEIGLVARLAQGKRLPVAGGPYAHEFVRRLKNARIDANELLQAVIDQGLHVPDFEVFDDELFMASPTLQYVAETILLQHYDRWRRQDGLSP